MNRKTERKTKSNGRSIGDDQWTKMIILSWKTYWKKPSNKTLKKAEKCLSLALLKLKALAGHSDFWLYECLK